MSTLADTDRQQVQAGRDILEWDIDGFATSDELLCAGEPGLRFFEVFAPLYSQYTHTVVDYRSEILGPYRNLRGIDLAAFRHDAAGFAGASVNLDESRHVLLSSFRGLGSHWRGDGAERAGSHIDRFLGLADEIGQDIGALGRTAGRLGAGIAEQVRSRARVALELYAYECGGLPYPAVEELVDSASSQPASATTFARETLDRQFVPEFEARLAQFREVALAAVEDSIRGLWSDFSDITAQWVLATDPFADLPLVMPSSTDTDLPSQPTVSAVDPQLGSTADPPGGCTEQVTAALERNVALPYEQISGIDRAGGGGPVSTRPAAFAMSGLSGPEPASGVALPDSWADGGGQSASAAGWGAGGSAGPQPGGATLAQGDAGQPGPGGATLGTVADAAPSDRTGSASTVPMTGGASFGGGDDHERSGRDVFPSDQQAAVLALVARLRERFASGSSNPSGSNPSNSSNH